MPMNPRFTELSAAAPTTTGRNHVLVARTSSRVWPAVLDTANPGGEVTDVSEEQEEPEEPGAAVSNMLMPKAEVRELPGDIAAVLLAWIAMATQEEICSSSPRRFLDSDFHKALLACLAFHFGFALPTDRRELDIKRAQYGTSRKLLAATERYWGFDDDDDGCFEVYYSQPKACIPNVPEPIATQLLSDAHTKGPHRLLDLDSPATVKLIGEAYNQGSPCDAVEVAHFLEKRHSYTTVKVNV